MSASRTAKSASTFSTKFSPTASAAVAPGLVLYDHPHVLFAPSFYFNSTQFSSIYGRPCQSLIKPYKKSTQTNNQPKEMLRRPPSRLDFDTDDVAAFQEARAQQQAEKRLQQKLATTGESAPGTPAPVFATVCRELVFFLSFL
jgi:hypothetical protein